MKDTRLVLSALLMIFGVILFGAKLPQLAMPMLFISLWVKE